MAETIAELEARLAAAADPRARIDALNALAWELRGEQLARAYELAVEARKAAQEHAYKLGEARATRLIAMTIRDPEQMGELMQMAQDAKRLFDEAGDATGRAASRDFLASIYEHLGETTIALDLALDALSIARSIGHPIRQGYALSNVGGLLAASGDVDTGVERLQEALLIFQNAKDDDGIAVISTRLSNVMRSAGRSAEALKYAQICCELAVRTDNEWAHSSALSVMAELERELGHLDIAEKFYRQALQVLTNETSKALLGSTIQVSLGNLLLKQGALAEATEVLNDALQRVEGNRVSAVTESNAHQALAELCEKRGELPAAITHLRRAQSLKDELAQREARNKLAQVEARAALDAAQKDAEIHKLRFVELHSMQSKLFEAEKMALLGTLAAGAAHELNTPLGVLNSNVRLSGTVTSRLLNLVNDNEVGTQVKKLVAVLESCRQSTEQAVERLSAVAQSFGRFTQLDQADVRPYDVREGLNSALAMLEPSVPARVTVERLLQDVPLLDAWPRELNQAFLTVLKNAVEAIEGAGVVSVETTWSSDQVFVRVRDSGRGMSAEKAARLFDMAWSEEGARTKMRMGLCAAQATTRKHGGEIVVDSALGRGTTVTFALPVRRA